MLSIAIQRVIHRFVFIFCTAFKEEMAKAILGNSFVYFSIIEGKFDLGSSVEAVPNIEMEYRFPLLFFSIDVISRIMHYFNMPFALITIQLI